LTAATRWRGGQTLVESRLSTGETECTAGDGPAAGAGQYWRRGRPTVA